MAINSINTVTAAAAASTQTTTKSAEKTSETTKKAASSKTASGVIYEKSSDSRTDKASNKTTSKTDNAAIVAKLKADAEQRTAQLRSIVEQMMTKQGVTGDDPDKADAMLEAFKKGFEQATKAWGDKLPDISQRTYDAVVEKFNKWKNGTEDASTEA